MTQHIAQFQGRSKSADRGEDIFIHRNIILNFNLFLIHIVKAQYQPVFDVRMVTGVLDPADSVRVFNTDCGRIRSIAAFKITVGKNDLIRVFFAAYRTSHQYLKIKSLICAACRCGFHAVIFDNHHAVFFGKTESPARSFVIHYFQIPPKRGNKSVGQSRMRNISIDIRRCSEFPIRQTHAVISEIKPLWILSPEKRDGFRAVRRRYEIVKPENDIITADARHGFNLLIFKMNITAPGSVAERILPIARHFIAAA